MPQTSLHPRSARSPFVTRTRRSSAVDSVRKAGGGFDWTTTGIRLVFERTVAGLIRDSSTGRLWTDSQGNLYRG